MNTKNKLRPLVVALLGLPAVLVLWQANYAASVAHQIGTTSDTRELATRIGEVHSAVRAGNVVVIPESARTPIEMALQSQLADLQNRSSVDDVQSSRFLLFVAAGFFLLQLAIAVLPWFRKNDGTLDSQVSRQSTGEMRAT